jgi:dCMP deaminase
MKNYSKLFMDIAERTAIESNCIKYKVGAVIVKDNRIILQGYNGTISGFINCSDKFYKSSMDSCVNRDEHSKWSSAFEIHSEMNIICYAAKKGISLEGTTIYCTHAPCNNCLKHLIQAGIIKIVFKYDFTDNTLLEDRKELLKLIEIKKCN